MEVFLNNLFVAVATRLLSNSTREGNASLSHTQYFKYFTVTYSMLYGDVVLEMSAVKGIRKNVSFPFEN